MRSPLEEIGFHEWRPAVPRAFAVMCFRSESNGQFGFVEVQRDKWWTNASGKFAMNLGLWVPAVDLARAPEPKNFKADQAKGELYWTVTERLGQLEHREDIWWNIQPDTDPESLGRTVLKSWQNVGVPWFRSVADLNGVRSWLIKSRGLATAIFASEALGDKESVRQGMEEVFRERLHNARAILEWGRARGYFDLPTTQKLEWALMQTKQDLEKVLSEVFQKSAQTTKP